MVTGFTGGGLLHSHQNISILDALVRLQVDTSGHKWAQLVPTYVPHKWTQVDTKGAKLGQVEPSPSGAKWSQVDPSGSKWSSVDPSSLSLNS